MATIEYKKYLNSEKWRKKRAYYLRRWKYCFVCGTSKKIHLHHKSYKRLGFEKPKDLLLLCEKCHFYLHNIKKGYLPKRKSIKWTVYDTDMYKYYGTIPNFKGVNL
jgi:5-methylcytosine-specific restriction endonuclease McrA